MKKAVIIANSTKDAELSVTSAVADKLERLGITVRIKTDFLAGDAALDSEDFPNDADVIIVVGGDGSVLDAAKYSYQHGIPILCVNLGKVGYLSEVEPDSLDTLDSLVTGDYSIDEKMMLEVCYDGAGGRISRYAVNDVVISHDSFLGIANIRLEDSAGNSIKYRADGLIVATPQGSTAYSLSAGGPVVAHDVESIIVTPVCAHSFFNRSVLFNSADVLRVENVNNDVLKVSADGRLSFELAPGECATVRRADMKLHTVSFSKNSMFSNLFKKMRMLEDKN